MTHQIGTIAWTIGTLGPLCGIWPSSHYQGIALWPDPPLRERELVLARDAAAAAAHAARALRAHDVPRDAQAHVDSPHRDRGPDAQARARLGRLLSTWRGGSSAAARPRDGPHGLLP